VTRLERQAAAAGKKLAAALTAMENYDGDAMDVLGEARLALRGVNFTGTRAALELLVAYCSGDIQ
jgi:hypothetical protein